MNIKHFESEFSYTILQRGHTYFKKKKLKKITCDDKGNYRFVVAGTYNYNVDKKIIHVCGREFTSAVGGLIYAVCNENLLISPAEIKSFYSAVIRMASRFVEFSGLELLSDITPPEFGARLYLDMNTSGQAVARLMFIYGGEEFTPEQSRRKNPFCDRRAEACCELLVFNCFGI